MTKKINVNRHKLDLKSSCSTLNSQQIPFKSSINTPYDRTIILQRAIGNQGIKQLHKSVILQAKSKVDRSSNDKYELEANKIANKIIQTPNLQVQKQTHEKNRSLNNTFREQSINNKSSSIIQNQLYNYDIIQINKIKGNKPPILQRETGEADDPTYILNNTMWNLEAYYNAVDRWSGGTNIWSSLTSREARENFFRFVVNMDRTQCRPYNIDDPVRTGCLDYPVRETFRNACTGFASQFYIRFSQDRTGLTPDVLARLSSEAQIHVGWIPVKFQMPVFIASVPGHSFNAVFIGNDPTNINDYLFMEPQNDQIFTSSSETFRNVFNQGFLTISRLIGFSESSSYTKINDHVFIMNPSGDPVHQTLSVENTTYLENLIMTIFVAEQFDSFRVGTGRPGLTEERLRRKIEIDDEPYLRVLGLSYGHYVRDRLSGWPETRLIELGRFIIGRQFRRYPFGPTSTLTPEIFAELVNHPDIADRFSEEP